MDRLRSMRVMIVENDDLNATLLQLQLEREGLRIVGIAATVEAALQLLEAQSPQLAFLDFRLADGQDSAPVAVALRTRGIPFLVATGMDVARLPEVFAEAVKLSKPYTGSELRAALLALL
ncbi:response regulator [Stenotrophomonas mori]|uniref:Response regulator n=1 Tax=Stenotrophomonas mori TaxID=2871096 RepID=A0ABT0SFU7_9GAMM|nr:response regulator [Stenotrophomonas mori]MCL7713884.1 response regulator [Stenotrophomonas mori]